MNRAAPPVITTKNGEGMRAIYSRRFDQTADFRIKMWQVLCRQFFQRYVPTNATVLEIAAGYCEFINSIKAGQKFAVDLNPETAKRAAPEVLVYQTSATDLSVIPDNAIDVAFTSNFFEHITRDEILATIREVARVLKPGGHFLVLQPNIRFCGKDFWMFFDHITPLDQYSLSEALEMSGFQPIKTIVRFLPYTTLGKAPKSLLALRIYLALPLVWRFFGAQTFVDAVVMK